MGLFDNILSSFQDKVDKLRDSLVQLQCLQKATLQTTFEYRRIKDKWSLCKDSIEKGETNVVLSILNCKYDEAIQKLEKSLQDLSQKQVLCKSEISGQLIKNPVLLPLLLQDDFISKSKYQTILVNLVKAHKEGKIGDDSLKKIIAYKEMPVNDKERVYVKDDRTQYADVVLIDKDDKILFTIRNKNDDFCPGGYCLPGGHIEDGETPVQAARRELAEETGIELQMTDLQPLGEYVDSKSHIYYFIVRTDENPVVLQEREQIQYERVGFEDLDKKPLILNLQNNLQHLVEIPNYKLDSCVEDGQKILFDGQKIQKGADNLHLLKTDSYCALIKRNGEMFVYEQEDSLQKAKSVGLIKKRMFITRSGKTFMTTVWVKPDGTMAPTGESEKELDEDLKGVEKVVVGDHVVVTTKRGEREGVVETLVKTKEGAYIGLRTSEGKYTEAYLKSVKDLKVKSSSSPVVEKTKELKPSVDFIESLKKDGLDFSTASRLGGSSETFLVERDGKKYFLKKERPGKEGQLDAEVWADAVYNLLGLKAPISSVVEIEGSKYKVNEYIPYQELGSVSGELRKTAIENLRKGFVVDALLGNWDVIGANGDNILVSPSGEVYRIDNGSSFEYRAKGSLKSELDFLTSTKIGELDSMRKGEKITSFVKEVFGSLTDEQVKLQAQQLFTSKEAVLNVVYSSLKNVSERRAEAFKKRCDWLKEWAFAKEPEKGEWDKTPTDSSMPSIVTEKYFSDWDSFEIEGNEGMKETLKKNILEAEKRQEKRYKELADKLGVTVGELKHKLQDLTEKTFEILIPCIAVDSGERVFNKIFSEEGRFKSQFETGTSHGALSSSSRSREESERFAFSIDSEKNKEMRPIYGYAANNPRGNYGSGSGIPPSASYYGDIIVEIKKEKALKAATMTAEDSLGSTSMYVAVPFGKPHFSVWNLGYGSSSIVSELEDFISGKTNQISSQGSYLELQYHNQLLKDDVEMVHVNVKTSRGYDRISDSINQMIELGIKTGKAYKFDLYSE